MAKYGITEYPNTFKRQASFSLDSTSTWQSYAEAEEYAATNPTAYELQPLTIKDGDKIRFCVLKEAPTGSTITIDGVIKSRKYMLIDITEYIDKSYNKIGTFSLTNRIDNLTCELLYDVLYPISADAFDVYLDDKNISGMISTGDNFVTAPIIFDGDTIKLYLDFFKFNVVDERNYPKFLFRVEAKILYKTDDLTLGTLHLVDLPESESRFLEQLNNGNEITLTEDIQLINEVYITKDTTINLNGYNITSCRGVFVVDNEATLTINGNDISKVWGGSGDEFACILVKDGNCIINGGNYRIGKNGSNGYGNTASNLLGNKCINVRKGQCKIYEGTFSTEKPLLSEDGAYYVLNKHDNSEEASLIIYKGLVYDQNLYDDVTGPDEYFVASSSEIHWILKDNELGYNGYYVVKMKDPPPIE